MSSFKSSGNIKKKRGWYGPDRSVSNIQFSSLTLNEVAKKNRESNLKHIIISSFTKSQMIVNLQYWYFGVFNIENYGLSQQYFSHFKTLPLKLSDFYPTLEKHNNQAYQHLFCRGPSQSINFYDFICKGNSGFK